MIDSQMHRPGSSPYLDEVGEGVYAYIQPDGGWLINNAGIIGATDGQGYVLVDTASTEARNRALFAAAANIAGTELQALVNTHHHPDHTYGNWLVPAGVPIISSFECRDALIRADFEAARNTKGTDFGHLELRPPNQTFSGEMVLHAGSRQIRLISLGPAHTFGDVVVWLPEERICFAGDLVFSGGHPFLVEGSIDGYRKALEFLHSLKADALVPGHGPVCRGEQIPVLLDKLDDYAAFVQHLAAEGLQSGLTPLEVSQQAPPTPFDEWNERERLVANVIRAYEEAKGTSTASSLDMGPVWSQMTHLRGGPIVSKA